MASYEDDHNISEETQTRGRETSRRPRLELDEFFETLGQQDRTGFSADPFTSLARAFGDMGDGSSRSMVIDNLVETLLNEAGSGKKVHGVPDGFLDTLERVSKKKLKESDSCVICGMRFLDDPYPLVVRLPCHTAHIFDLECIAPWLKLHTTCPLDRKDLLKKPTPPPPPPGDDHEGEWDEYYG